MLYVCPTPDKSTATPGRQPRVILGGSLVAVFVVFIISDVWAADWPQSHPGFIQILRRLLLFLSEFNSVVISILGCIC